MKDKYWNYTFNIIEGFCNIKCGYCWANRMKQRFKLYNGEPRFNEKAFLKFKNFKGAGRIFVNNMIESLSDNYPKAWMQKIIDNAPRQCISILLTKLPVNLYYHFNKNWWVGTSITNKSDCYRLLSMKAWCKGASKQFISFEPLLGDCTDIIPKEGIDWVIIGGLNPKNVHKKEWVDSMVDRAREYNIPVWLKLNLHYDKVIQEDPSDKVASFKLHHK